jgi:predicted DNA-binding ribbon-helix-helix protein
MKSPVVKRSIVIAGHKTSVSLEDAFWTGLKDIALARHITLSDLVAAIDSERRHGNLSSAIRLFVLNHYQAHTNGHADQPSAAIVHPAGRLILTTPAAASPTALARAE